MAKISRKPPTSAPGLPKAGALMRRANPLNVVRAQAGMARGQAQMNRMVKGAPSKMQAAGSAGRQAAGKPNGHKMLEEYIKETKIEKPKINPLGAAILYHHLGGAEEE